MKNFKNYKGYALYIFLCVVLCVGCKTEKVAEHETFPLTQEQIMVIFENGYKNGALNILKNGYYDSDIWVKDSVLMAVRWQ